MLHVTELKFCIVFIEKRYTAVTCDADEFENEKYNLRQNWSGRETELLVSCISYEDDR